MHRTATRLRLRIEGTVGLELDNGTEVTLRPGDIVVQNGTRHRWHNRGTTIARVLAFSAGLSTRSPVAVRYRPRR
jgi:quercetin dioxygenase-like cupin family protein